MRLIDLLLVRKNEDGTVEKLEIADLEELAELGALAGALLGLGAAGEEGAEVGAAAGAEAMAEDGSVFDESDVWYLADALPVGMAAAIVVLEHRWAIPLRNAITRPAGGAGGQWLHPAGPARRRRGDRTRARRLTGAAESACRAPRGAPRTDLPT